MTPRLVVMTGYPSSGKSKIAYYMQEELGFCRVGNDDLREMLYRKNYPRLMQDERADLKENLMWGGLDYLRMLMISQGLDTVVDTTAPNNDMRKQWLNTRHANGEFPAEKYLMFLRVDREELLRRDHPESVEVWDNYWEEPEQNPVGYEILSYQNNTVEDREAIFVDLRLRFGRKGKLWVPVSS